jgi:type II secretory pathway pseudopilin PulG
MRKEIAMFLMLIVIFALVYSIWLFQNQTSDAQKQTVDLQNQLAYYENSTDTLQTRVSNLETQLRDLQNPIYNVTIANVSSTPWVPMVGLAVDKGIYITVKNIGVTDVGGFTIEFKPPSDTSCEISLIEPEQIGVLHVQESIVLTAHAISTVGVSFEGKSVVITLMLDETVLDERTVPLFPDYGKSAS